MAIAVRGRGEGIHVAARSQQNPRYPQRFAVSDDQVPWTTPFPEYAPAAFNVDFRGASWADPPDPRAIPDLQARLTHEDALTIDPATGAPVNPVGRTGLCGRGMLGRWGPNHAADPIVTRYEPISGELQFVAIQRTDTGAWALPGGMVDPGESVSLTLKREFTEETGNLTGDLAQRQRALADELFGAGGVTVFSGYVDDPRNTDNAWMESVAVHFHCSWELGALLPLQAGDDAAKAKWMTYQPGLNLYADPRAWIDVVAGQMPTKAQPPAAPAPPAN